MDDDKIHLIKKNSIQKYPLLNHSATAIATETNMKWKMKRNLQKNMVREV